MSKLQFYIIDSTVKIVPSDIDGVYLVKDNWDDWAKYETKFNVVILKKNKIEAIGSVKIGETGLKPAPRGETKPGFRSPNLPIQFTELPKNYFSLGLSESYYESLSQYPDYKDNILNSLNDIAYNMDQFYENKSEEVMSESILRTVPESKISRYSRLANGDANATPFEFKYTFNYLNQGTNNTDLSFSVTPESFPPTNVYVIIGRNGVGKTTLFSNMINSLTGKNLSPFFLGEFIYKTSDKFNDLVSISFSAFDTFDPPFEKQNNNIKYNYVGLKSRSEDDEAKVFLRDPNDLAEYFYFSLKNCRMGVKKLRLKKTLQTLESDPLFHSSDVSNWCLNEPSEERLLKYFKNLSSGHKIVLLTVTKLVELVEEKTIVIIDEPEAHLHPPLLSALIRALSDLLIQRNGVALIATHSPVVLQEIPRNCSWVLHRSGPHIKAERPSIETFGENLGVLTREIFGFEVNKSGFHSLIEKKKNELWQYENLSLGSEAKAQVIMLQNPS